MDWIDIIGVARIIKEQNFDRSYKSLKVDRPIGNETLGRHLKILFEALEKIRTFLKGYYDNLTPSHKIAAEAYFLDVRNKLANLLESKGIENRLSVSFHDEVVFYIKLEEVGENIDCESLTKLFDIANEAGNMTQSVTDFLGLATRVIPDFNGSSENLQSFLDALDLIDSVKETHKQIAVRVIKTKLKGTARNLISSEGTIKDIIITLRKSVKGESTEVITAKILNIRQGNKTANSFVSEIEELTKALSNAYISDGLPVELAQKYSTQVAVKTMSKNASSDRVRLIMESGNFSTMNDAVSKFVSSCTEGMSTFDVRYYNSKWYGRGNSRGRGNGHYRGRGRYYRNNRGRGSNNHNFDSRNNKGNRNRNVRILTEENNDSGNLNLPLGEQ